MTDEELDYSRLDSTGASASKAVPIYRYAPRLFFSRRWSVGLHPGRTPVSGGKPQLGITKLEPRGEVPGSRSSNISGCSLHRVRCLPELFPTHSSCKKDR
jgi:hypothetical protein